VTLLNRLPDAAAIVLDAKYDVIAWNPLAAALLEDFSALAPRDRNLIRRHFLPPNPTHRGYGMSHGHEFGLFAAAHLRAVSARYPDDPDIHALIDELLAGSTEFARIWASHHVNTAHTISKTI
jgi:hypothetical protein